MLYRLRIYLLFSDVAVLVLATAEGTAQTISAWRSVTTKNFTVIGDAPESDLRSEAARLETFREAFCQLYPNLKLGDAKPTTVVLFKNATAFEALLPKRADGIVDDGVTGYFLSGERQNYIALALDLKRQSSRSPIVHEFIHLVLESNVERASLPPWLNEGLAEYFEATVSAGDGALIIGGENRGHLQLLRRVGLIPISELVSITADKLKLMPVERRRQFYAESWLLARELVADGKLKIYELPAKLGKLSESSDPIAAAFGVNTTALQAALTKTLAERALTFTTTKVATNAEPVPAAASMPPGRSSALLGDLLFEMGDADRADGYLKKALAADNKEPLANALYGKLLVTQNKLSEAKSYLKKVIDAGSTDHWVYYDYAYALSQEFISEGLIGDIPDGAAVEILCALRRSIELEPNFVESYHLAAVIDLARDENLDEASVFLKRAIMIKPDDAGLKLLLARVMLRRDDTTAARQLAEQAAASTDIKKKTEAAEIIKTADEVSASRGAVNIPIELSLSVARRLPIAVLKRSWLSDADLDRIEIDRVNNNFNRLIIREHPGEQQVLGRIKQITCDGNEVTFDVNTGSDKLTLRSVGFSSIRMTVAQEAGNSYSLGCGATLDKVLSVINYQPAPTGRGTVTAISFVPDGFRLKSLKEMMAARMVAIDDDTLRRGAPSVKVNEESARRSIQNDLRKPHKDETRLLGQIEKIECSDNNWVMQVTAGGQHLKFGPPRSGEPSLGWFTVASTQLPLECGSGIVPAYAVFTFAKSDMLDGELHAIEFVPEGFMLTPSGR